VDYALALVSGATATASPTPPRLAAKTLTRRESEIAQFLARGYTDRQIAETLFLTAGTVGWHVHRILQKLELHSRRQLAGWLHAQESGNPSAPGHIPTHTS
jgi:DNA-binding NarL/FixJ family response regulator